MNLCIDIGNTSTKAALFSNGELIEYYKPFTLEKLEEIKTKYDLNILASRTGSDEGLERHIARDEWLTHETPLPISLDYKTPETLGRDRIATAVGAWAMDGNATWVIVDLGTCLTLDLLVRESFKGGLISPGVQMRFKAMHEFTAGLPLVQQDYEIIFPGKSTEESMQVGVCQSIEYEISGFIRQVNKMYERVKIVDCSSKNILFDKEVKNEIFARPKLVVEGLNKILEYNAQL